MSQSSSSEFTSSLIDRTRHHFCNQKGTEQLLRRMLNSRSMIKKGTEGIFWARSTHGVTLVVGRKARPWKRTMENQMFTLPTERSQIGHWAYMLQTRPGVPRNGPGTTSLIGLGRAA